MNEDRNLRILFLTRVYPYPATSGALSYTCSVLQGLLAAGASVDVICNLRDESRGIPITPSPNLIWTTVPLPRFSRLKALFSGWPGEVLRFWSPEYTDAALRKLSRAHYDAVVVDHFGAAGALKDIRGKFEGVLPAVVYLSHNFETRVRFEVARFFTSEPHKIIYGLIDSIKVARTERSLCRSSKVITAISEDDMQDFERISPANIVLISPSFSGLEYNYRIIDSNVPKNILLLGSLEWHAKSASLLEFLKRATPIFEENNIQLNIVGRASPDICRKISQFGTSVTYHGFVENLKDSLNNARLGLMIDQVGGGFKTKLLDYFFGGVPVLGIRAQMGGLSDFREERDYLAADNIDTLLNVIVTIISDHSRLDEIQKSAFHTATTVFSDETRTAQISKLISTLEIYR